MNVSTVIQIILLKYMVFYVSERMTVHHNEDIQFFLFLKFIKSIKYSVL